jgi:hypothetical protein
MEEESDIFDISPSTFQEVSTCIFEDFIGAIMASVEILNSAYAFFVENIELAQIFLLVTQ